MSGLRGVMYMLKKKVAENRALWEAAKTGVERRETTSHLTLKHERTYKTGNSQGQCQLFKITRKDETIRCYGQ